METKFIILIALFVILLGSVTYLLVAQPQQLQSQEETNEIESLLGKFNPDTPQVTLPLNDVPLGVVELKVSRDKGFEPNEFSVKAGDVVSVALTSMDGTHSFYFEDSSLEKVRIDVSMNETRGISFVVPEKPGEYIFYCDLPGHREANGEEGKMIVK